MVEIKRQKAKNIHNVDKQVADRIYNADTIHIVPSESSPEERAKDLLQRGVGALREGLYTSAIAHLTESVGLGILAPSATADARFFLALAALGGRRPSLCSGPQVASVLATLAPLPASHTSARFLAVLVNEDRTNAWMESPGVPEDLRRMVERVDRSHAGLICRHVPAPESRIWRALYDHAGGSA